MVEIGGLNCGELWCELWCEWWCEQRVIVEVVECRAMYSCIAVECCRGCRAVEALQPPRREAT